MDIPGVTYNPDSQVKVVDANYDNAKMSQEDFLKVLLADLQWQDPLEAKDISEFIDNTVKLKELESYNTFQQSVEQLLAANQANALLTASSLIGKLVKYEGNQTYVQNGVGYADIKLASSADTVKITILDSTGSVVETKTLYNLQGGVDYPISIENPDLPDGYYTVSIEATLNGNPVDATVISQALIIGVEKDTQGNIVLNTSSFTIENSNLIGIGG
ncbi:flagellar hook assembly protein FlgD [Desulfurobacterium atlanticum]|uniref:Basal-body rod modification protein FlgD n=1 Tax=Desulfurobacterium atlanticum TaxID=240169 RepID=A0A238YZI5_9BACT|nr:flagellar hook capping FlgD N-terminal domain-containing protein [Desulfurobacterium atlanticum]SNR76497.1 flagellar basal-body rod modification protein FlgD [Desulfurobacterium atlanticum]